MPISVTPAQLFKTAAFLSAISVPGHVIFGLDTVHPTLSSIKIGNRKSKAGHASATASYNYVNGALAILGMLSLPNDSDHTTIKPVYHLKREIKAEC
jgi:hypothetical protein